SHCFFFQAEDGIRDRNVTGVQTCALPISQAPPAEIPEEAAAHWCPSVASGWGLVAGGRGLVAGGRGPADEGPADEGPVVEGSAAELRGRYEGPQPRGTWLRGRYEGPQPGLLTQMQAAGFLGSQ